MQNANDSGPVLGKGRSLIAESVVKEAAAGSLKISRMNTRFMNSATSKSLHNVNSIPYKIVKSAQFQIFMYTLIVVSVVWIGISLDLDPNLELPADVSPRDDSAELFLDVYRQVMCSLFTLEFLLRLFSYKNPLDFFRDPGERVVNCIDFFVLFVIIVDVWILEFTEHQETIAIRLLRLTLLFRLGHVLRRFTDLRILVRAVLGSMKAIGISLLPLLAVIYTFGVLMTEWCRTPGTPYLADFGDYFGTVQRSMLTMWQISMADGVFDLIRDIITEAPVWGCALILFMFIGNFMILNVLVGVIREVVFTTSSSFKLEFVQSVLENLYDKLSRNGRIQEDELVTLGASQLKRFGLDASLIPTVFHQMDINGTGEIPRDIFVLFFLRVLRSPESQDLLIALKTASGIRTLARAKRVALARSILANASPTNNVE